MIALDDLRAFLHDLEIAHHVRGRVRLKLVRDPQFQQAPSGALIEQIQHLLENLPGVRSVRLNLLARSCVVEYDPETIPPDAWADFLSGEPSTAATTLENVLMQAYQEVTDALS